jgi:hypothetical protein
VVLALPSLLFPKKYFSRRTFGLIFVVALTLLLSMISWSFSPQAITRYLLPVWFWMAVCCSKALSSVIKESVVFRSIKLSLLILLSYSFFIESKVLFGRLNPQSSIWTPVTYWKNTCPDGPLLVHWNKIKHQNDRVFYAGSAGVLMAGEGHWLAQAGNEVGWRAPEKLKKFLSREKLRWWIIARSAIRVDPVYQALSDEAERLGLIEKVIELDSGLIYRVKKQNW